MTAPVRLPAWTAQDGAAHDHVRQCLALSADRFPPDEVARIEACAKECFRRAAWRFLDGHSPEHLLGVLRVILQLLDTQQPEDVGVYVGTPQLEANGWAAHNTVILVAIRDRPFVYDSVKEYILGEVGLLLDYIHPVLSVARRDGHAWVESARGALDREACLVFEIPHVDETRAAALEAGIRAVLEQVILATDDYDAMRGRLERLVVDLDAQATMLPRFADDLRETTAFLEWLRNRNFVFLGYREYAIVDADGERALTVRPGTGLGILRDHGQSSVATPVPVTQLSDDLRDMLTAGPVVTVTKSSNQGVVHRRAQMDYISVKRLDRDGAVAGEFRILGLFTAKALGSPAREIPLLRRKLGVLLDRTGLPPGAHDYKQLVELFEGIPKDELFQVSVDELQSTIDAAALAEREGTVRCVIREHFSTRTAFVTVIMSRDKFNATARQRIQEVLTARFGAPVTDYRLALTGNTTARLHFQLTRDGGETPTVARGELELELAKAVETWPDRLQAYLRVTCAPDTATQIGADWAHAFPDGYQETTDAPEAAADIHMMREALAAGAPRISLRDPVPGEQATRLKLYAPDARVILSDVMPVLEALGLRVIDEVPTEVPAPGGRCCFIHDFGVVTAHDEEPLEVSAVAERVSEAVLRVLAGDAHSDRINALIIRAGLQWREVALLRAYVCYFRQLGTPYTAAHLSNVLGKYADLCRLLYEYFVAKFSPTDARAVETRRTEVLPPLRKAIEERIMAIKSLEDDRIFRTLFNLLEATVRTNYFRGGGTSPHISFKIRSAEVLQMPLPRPVFEIFVYSPTMEGIHLRGGMVARGGIRWSDRRADYRTEVLGLMKTQMTKNAVIVPVGSKGGFIIRTPSTNRTVLAEQVIREYSTLIRGLLDLTDNPVDGAPGHPPDVVVYDGVDPYLVVAADKGTAHLSDTANALSAEYDYWLGDAFASGGSAGYDHKKEGITARGAWECGKRHFRERGIDIQSQPFTVVGIGDMGGDVFGNGMLQSKTTKLVAAFNHLHIFFDPDPDPARTWTERKRLFELPRSTWRDYDPTLISAGGGVFDRREKRIPLSPEVRALLDVTAHEMSGPDLIRAILCAPVDMLYNGGIGTYIKHSGESNVDVGDKANDSVRVDARDVRAAVVVEGGNLGITQLGRIELAQHGVRLNTDAIDNSGGVDMSDHEVNLKILLKQAIADGLLDARERDQLLEDLTDTVSAHVLRTNYLQSLLLTQAEAVARERPWELHAVMRTLVERADLDRATEFLPEEEELLAREAAGTGLTRPELAVLVGYVKNWLTALVWESPLSQDPHLHTLVRGYFPPRVANAYGHQIAKHRLRRELAATIVSNHIVNQAGISFVERVCEHTGADPVEVVWAYLIGDAMFRFADLRRALFDLDGIVPTDGQYATLCEMEEALEDTTLWLLQNVPPLSPISDVLARFRSRAESTQELLLQLHEEVETAEVEARRALYADRGFSEAAAADFILLPAQRSLLDVLLVSEHTNAPLADIAYVYIHAFHLLGLPWLLEQAHDLQTMDPTERIALQSVCEDFEAHHRHLVYAILRGRQAGEPAEAALKRYSDARAREINRYLGSVAQVQSSSDLTLARLIVLVHELRRI